MLSHWIAGQPTIAFRLLILSYVPLEVILFSIASNSGAASTAFQDHLQMYLKSTIMSPSTDIIFHSNRRSGLLDKVVEKEASTLGAFFVDGARCNSLPILCALHELQSCEKISECLMNK